VVRLTATFKRACSAYRLSGCFITFFDFFFVPVIFKLKSVEDFWEGTHCSAILFFIFFHLFSAMLLVLSLPALFDVAAILFAVLCDVCCQTHDALVSCYCCFFMASKSHCFPLLTIQCCELSVLYPDVSILAAAIFV
jgi:hypothetical protein